MEEWCRECARRPNRELAGEMFSQMKIGLQLNGFFLLDHVRFCFQKINDSLKKLKHLLKCLMWGEVEALPCLMKAMFSSDKTY